MWVGFELQFYFLSVNSSAPAILAVDFSQNIGYYESRNYRRLENLKKRRRCGIETEVPSLKKTNGFAIFVAILSALAAIAGAAVAIAFYFEKKKKDEEELEHYLDCSIQ